VVTRYFPAEGTDQADGLGAVSIEQAVGPKAFKTIGRFLLITLPRITNARPV
jgi:hypothetical protein